MEDLFYFSKMKLDLVIIETYSRTQGYITALLSTEINLPAQHPELRIIYDDKKRGYWAWREIKNGAGIVFEQDESTRIEAMGVKSSFSISYFARDLPRLARYLQLFMKQYGGWIGRDDSFEVLYTADNILSIKTLSKDSQ